MPKLPRSSNTGGSVGLRSIRAVHLWVKILSPNTDALTFTAVGRGSHARCRAKLVKFRAIVEPTHQSFGASRRISGVTVCAYTRKTKIRNGQFFSQSNAYAHHQPTELPTQGIIASRRPTSVAHATIMVVTMWLFVLCANFPGRAVMTFVAVGVLLASHCARGGVCSNVCERHASAGMRAQASTENNTWHWIAMWQCVQWCPSTRCIIIIKDAINFTF